MSCIAYLNTCYTKNSGKKKQDALIAASFDHFLAKKYVVRTLQTNSINLLSGLVSGHLALVPEGQTMTNRFPLH